LEAGVGRPPYAGAAAGSAGRPALVVACSCEMGYFPSPCSCDHKICESYLL
jgi:hypothetical protein